MTGYERYDLLNVVRGVSDVAFSLILAAIALYLHRGLVAVAVIRLLTEVVADVIRFFLGAVAVWRTYSSVRISPAPGEEMAGFGGILCCNGCLPAPCIN